MAKPYLVTYDLYKPGQDYPRIAQELEILGAERVLYSTWVLQTNGSALELYNYLAQFVDGNDKLLVVALTGEAVWNRLRIPDDQFRQKMAA